MLPIFAALPPDTQATLHAHAQAITLPAGETLFAEGDPATALFAWESGRCVISREARPIGEWRKGDTPDLVATLGGLPHTLRAVAIDDCHFLRWEMDTLLRSPDFAAAARRTLAQAALVTQARLETLTAPVPYQGESAQLLPGPFVFKNMTMILALCDATHDSLRETLPEGLRLFRPAWRRRDSLLIALADFPLAYPDHTPQAQFAYTETTFFVPVRCGRAFGLFVPYIYPSAYAPVLLGREVYGFPKRLGETIFTDRGATLAVEGAPMVDFISGAQTRPAGEPHIIRALSDWVGIQGRVVEAVFRLGDAALNALGTPLLRRVPVYNHKRIPSATTTHAAPVYDVDMLTQAIFSVTHWHSIAHLPEARLTVRGGPFRFAEVTLRAAFLTRLDMRLSTGRDSTGRTSRA